MSVITQGLKSTALITQGYGVAGLSTLREPLTAVRRTAGLSESRGSGRLIGERGGGGLTGSLGVEPIHATRSNGRFGAR